MGNRDDLLAGARRCLEEKGYARTTVRDIAAAAQVSMAAIGYHFGSREALLNEVLFAALDEWSAEIAGAAGADYEDMWVRKIASFTRHRWLWAATMEAFVHAQNSPALSEFLAAGQHVTRQMIVEELTGVPVAEVDDREARTLGSVHMALTTGVMVQWLTDPERAPSGQEILEGLRALTARLE